MLTYTRISWKIECMSTHFRGEAMAQIERSLKEKLDRVLERGRSILLLGPRQTGKTTLISSYSADLEITLLFSKTRRQYESDPDLLIRQVKALHRKNGALPLIVIDEVQKVPPLMDGVQYLIDEKLGQFILTGSSARKLKHGSHVNMLPGRLIQMRLDPLTADELDNSLPDIEDFLLYGSLPQIRLEQNKAIREEELESYVDLYLEDEVRAEALVRDIGAFENFLKLAAIESGNIVNFDKIAQDISIARSTVSSYYQILEDCLITERVDAFTESVTRKKLVKSPKYLFFDLGLRRLAAQELPALPQKYLGSLFEQFVGLELIKWARLQESKTFVYFWRDGSGPEVDFVIKSKHGLIPIQVKWTENPSPRDAKHLNLFLKEYESAKKGFVVCRADKPQILGDEVEAISWKNLCQKLQNSFE